MVKRSVVYLPFILLATIFSAHESRTGPIKSRSEGPSRYMKDWLTYISEKMKGYSVHINKIPKDKFNEIVKKVNEEGARFKAALAINPDDQELIELADDNNALKSALQFVVHQNETLQWSFVRGRAITDKAIDGVRPTHDVAQELLKALQDNHPRFKGLCTKAKRPGSF